MLRLLALFTLLPLVDLVLTAWLGAHVGFWPTVASILVAGALGAYLAKRQGLAVLREWRDAIAEGRVPADGLLGGLLVLVGGVLLVTPGVLTDVVGLAFLFGPTRRAAARWLGRYFERRVRDGSVRVVSFSSFDGMPAARARAYGPDVIDTTGEELPVEPPPRLPG